MSEDKIKPISIYLAGPVDGIDDLSARGWREEIASLVGMNILVVSPPHALLGTGNPGTAESVTWIMRSLVMACDCLLANLDGEGRAIGTCREIEFAKLSSKPVVVYSRQALVSLMSYDLDVVDDVEEAIKRLVVAVQKQRGQTGQMFAFLRGGPFMIQGPEEEPEDED